MDAAALIEVAGVSLLHQHVEARRREPYRRVSDVDVPDYAPKDVDDPYEPGATIRVMRSLRNDPLAGLHARNHIDEAQYQAGRAFQHDFETAERGPRAIDPSKEAVDGGLAPEAITEAQRKAAKMLARAHRQLGANGSALTHDVLIHGKTHCQSAESRGLDGRRWEEYFGMRFRECLDCLALVYGFAMER